MASAVGAAQNFLLDMRGGFNTETRLISRKQLAATILTIQVMAFIRTPVLFDLNRLSITCHKMLCPT
jgi:hypothetical protein